jgi:hypothetical protein
MRAGCERARGLRLPRLITICTAPPVSPSGFSFQSRSWKKTLTRDPVLRENLRSNGSDASCTYLRCPFAGIPAVPRVGPSRRFVRKHQQDIRILNPVAGCGFTSANRARRFVAQGRAIWVDPEISIRFVASDHRHCSAAASLVATRYWYDRAVNVGVAQLEALANLPMIAPAVALGIGKRKGASRYTFLATQGL